MAGQQMKFAFSIGEVVMHRDHDLQGGVVGLWVDRSMVHYCAVERLKADGSLVEDWFRCTELVRVEQ